MKVYLAGPIKGVDNYFAIFAEAAQKLRIKGHEVFNPAAANLEGLPMGRILSYELSWLCEQAEAIAVLPGWRKSGGTRIELAIAMYLKLKIMFL